MIRESGRPSTFQVPQQIGGFNPGRRRPAGADAVGVAVTSMGLAAQQLGLEKTKEAIPHEMAALAGPACRRRRRFTGGRLRSSRRAASGNGGGRQGQDLSALFDKELQRQQRNNYETRSQIDQRPDA